MQFNLNGELGAQINIWIQILGGEEKAFKNLLHHLKSFQVLLSFLRFSITMQTDTWELMSLPIRAWKNLYELITSYTSYDTEPYRTGKKFQALGWKNYARQAVKHSFSLLPRAQLCRHFSFLPALNFPISTNIHLHLSPHTSLSLFLCFLSHFFFYIFLGVNISSYVSCPYQLSILLVYFSRSTTCFLTGSNFGAWWSIHSRTIWKRYKTVHCFLSQRAPLQLPATKLWILCPVST